MFVREKGDGQHSIMVDKKPVVLILNSAQSKYPIGSDLWIQATMEAANTLSRQNVKMLCSTGPVMWDIVTFLAGKNGMEIILVVKAHDDKAGHMEFGRLLEEYNLDESHTYPLYIRKIPENQPKKIWVLRDNFALRTADVVYPIFIRPGGRLDKLLSKADFREKIRNDMNDPEIAKLIKQDLKIQQIFQKVRVKKLPENILRQNDPDLLSFYNINSPDDLAGAENVESGNLILDT